MNFEAKVRFPRCRDGSSTDDDPFTGFLRSRPSSSLGSTSVFTVLGSEITDRSGDPGDKVRGLRDFGFHREPSLQQSLITVPEVDKYFPMHDLILETKGTSPTRRSRLRYGTRT